MPEGNRDLSTAERHSLHPALRQRVMEQLLDRYLAEQGYVDLAKKKRVYTKKFQDLTPEDLPALVEADRRRVEESLEERERADFIREGERAWSDSVLRVRQVA